MANQDQGKWEGLKDWPLIGIHTVVTQDGKVLTFGTDATGMQGAQFIYDVWDPETDTHYTLDNKTATDIFCSAALIIPGTDLVLIGGGDDRPNGDVNSGVNHANVFDNTDMSLSPIDTGVMNYARWYPTMVSLPSGQVVIIGGSDGDHRGVATPEIYTPGEGWRALDGATRGDIASTYIRSWLNGDGEIVMLTGDRKVLALDPSGDGSVREIGTMPFSTGWDAPSIMFESGKVLIQATNGDLWTMDITGQTPVFAKTESLSQDRNWADMTVLADGSVMINGGSSVNNTLTGVDKTAAIWDPETGQITYGVDEANARLYHSTSVLLADGSLLSLGGGAPGPLKNLNGEIYKPPYLFDENGNEATRPVITDAPEDVVPGQTFTITVDDASAIEKLTFVKNGATTHSLNMEARMVHLDFTRGPGNTLEVKLPENANEVVAGNWMLFAWNDAGVPSKAPILSVEPTIAHFDGTGDLKAEYFTIATDVTSLDQIDFDDTPTHVENASEIDENSSGAFHIGGQPDDFAVRYTGEFDVARTGSHTFHLTSDDGSRLYIDGQLVIDNDGMQAATQKTATLQLSAGIHDIKVEYFEGGGAGSVDLDWSGPGFNRKQMQFDGVVDNLLLNGSFETGEVGLGKAPYGWTVDGQAGRFVSNPITDARSPDGDAAVILGGWGADYGGGSISQTVETEPGRTYTLTFHVGKAVGANVIASLKAEALNGNIADLSETVTGTFSGSAKQYFSFTFTATGAQTTIKLSDTTSGNGPDYDLDLDNVQLIAGDIANQAPNAFDDTAQTDEDTAVLVDVLANDTDAENDRLSIVSVDVPSNGTAVIDDMGTADTTDDQILYTPDSGFSGTDTFGYTLSDGTTETTADISVTVNKDPGPDPEVNIIVAGAAGGYLAGTDGKDDFRGGDGLDVFYGGKGDDIYDGAGGDYNQVDFDGAASEYTFTRNPDGTVTVAHPEHGADTLKNIGGVWFGGEAKWYSLKNLVETQPPGQVNIINASDAGGYLAGTSGDDDFRGGAGVDVFYGGKGDDLYDGAGGDYNQVDFNGAAAEYDFVLENDGSVTVTHPEYGKDVLTNIGGVWFGGEAKWYPLSDLVDTPPTGGVNVIEADINGGYLGGTAEDDLFKGKAGNDVFYGGKGDDEYQGDDGYNQVNYDGSAGDYQFTLNQDGSTTVTHPEYGTDTLKDIGGIWFRGEGKWYSTNELAIPEPGTVFVVEATPEGGHLVGSAGDDEFRGGTGNDTFYGGKGDDIYKGGGGDYNQVDFDGKKSDYVFTKEADGSITASNAEYGNDILFDIDGVWFHGDGVWSSADDLVG